MITPNDITQITAALRKSFATKNDLKRFATKNDLQKFATKDDLNAAIKGLATRNDLITFKDEILHEIAKMRDEVAVVGGQRDMLEDHEFRIETIEKHLHIRTYVYRHSGERQRLQNQILDALDDSLARMTLYQSQSYCSA